MILRVKHVEHCGLEVSLAFNYYTYRLPKIKKLVVFFIFMFSK